MISLKSLHEEIYGGYRESSIQKKKQKVPLNQSKDNF